MTTVRRLIACTLLLLAGGCDDGGSAALVDPDRIDAVLRGYVERGELPGVSALVYEHGEEAYFGAFGMADRENGTAMQRDTLVRIYSMTKPLTGVTLMTFHEEGRFELDEPLAKYLPEFANPEVFVGEADGEPRFEAAERAPTVRDIMRHTAGFADEAGDDWLSRRYREAGVLDSGNTLADFSQALADLPLAYHPGTRWRYGDSVDVQARLVEVLSGKPFAAVLRERVLDPLGMTDTGYRVRPGLQDRLAVLYERRPDGSFGLAPAELAAFNTGDTPLTPGGWGLVSTLDDYMQFARMLLNDGSLGGKRILRPETVRLMATDMLAENLTDRSWLPGKGQVGFGIDFAVRLAPPAGPEEASGAVGEFFWDGYANTLFWVDPGNDLAAVLFVQYVPFGGTDVHKDFRDAVYHRDPVARAPAMPAPE